MKKLIAILLAFVLAFGMTACGEPEPAATEPTVPPTMAPYVPAEKTICLLVPESEDPWMILAADAAKTAAEDSAIPVTVQTYTDDQSQAKILEEIAAASNGDGSMGVVLMCAGEQSEAALQKLLEANVAYALADSIPESAAAASVANVHYDHRQIGAAAAAYLVNSGLTQKNDVVILEGVADEDALKTEGFKLYLEGKMEVNGAAIETPWDSFDTLAYSDMEAATREGAKTYFESYMEDGDRAYTGYFAAWDDTFLLGVLDALQDEYISSSSRSHLYAMEPVFTGFGADAELCDLLQTYREKDEEAESTKLDDVLDEIADINTIPYDATMLAQALAAMDAHMAGEVVEQEQLLSVSWWADPPVPETEPEE